MYTSTAPSKSVQNNGIKSPKKSSAIISKAIFAPNKQGQNCLHRAALKLDHKSLREYCEFGLFRFVEDFSGILNKKDICDRSVADIILETLIYRKSIGIEIAKLNNDAVMCFKVIHHYGFIKHYSTSKFVNAIMCTNLSRQNIFHESVFRMNYETLQKNIQFVTTFGTPGLLYRMINQRDLLGFTPFRRFVDALVYKYTIPDKWWNRQIGRIPRMILELLIENGACPETKDNNGISPIIYATELGYYRAAKAIKTAYRSKIETRVFSTRSYSKGMPNPDDVQVTYY